MKTILSICLLLLPATAARAQTDAPEDPVVSSLRGLHDITANYVLQAAEMLDDDMYAFRATEDVRTTGQLLAHIVGAQYMFCSIAAGEENPSPVNYEAEATTKDDILAALRASLEYCGNVYDNLTDEEGAEVRNLFGMPMAASAVLAFNSAHNFEHYGNIVTYMRLNDLVPPSSMQ